MTRGKLASRWAMVALFTWMLALNLFIAPHDWLAVMTVGLCLLALPVSIHNVVVAYKIRARERRAVAADVLADAIESPAFQQLAADLVRGTIESQADHGFLLFAVGDDGEPEVLHWEFHDHHEDHHHTEDA